MENTIPHLTYQQFRTVQRLVHQCCNNIDGNCLLLDDGWNPCVCVQSISRSLVCKYFRAAVLPLDRELETALLYKKRKQTLLPLWGAVPATLQPGKILP